MKTILKLTLAILTISFIILTSCDLDKSEKTVNQKKKNTIKIDTEETEKENLSTLEIDAKESADITCSIKKLMKSNSKKEKELAAKRYEINTKIWGKYKTPEEREKFSIAVVKFLENCKN